VKTNHFKGALLSLLLIASLALPLSVLNAPVPASAQEEYYAKAVDVTVLPHKQSATPCNWLYFTVKVTNWNESEEENDNYLLSVKDDLGWTIILSDNVLSDVAPGETRKVTMIVHIDNAALPSTHDNIIVTARSLVNENVSDSDLCVAHATDKVQYSVDVTVTPPLQGTSPGTWAAYKVSVYNAGTVADNYFLSYVQTLTWPMGFEVIGQENVTFENVQPCENRVITLWVEVPATGALQWNVVTVTATSLTDNTISNSDKCITYDNVNDVPPPYWVDVTILPHKKGGIRCNWIHFEATIRNWGTENDNYKAYFIPDGWPEENMYIFKSGLGTQLNPYITPVLSPGGTDTVDIYIHVPENEILAPVCEDKELIVVVESLSDNTFKDNDLLVVHVDNENQCAVDVKITPRLDSAEPLEDIYYTVTVHNVGNIKDSYHITVMLENENWDWGWSISNLTPDNQLENVWPCENVLVGVLRVNVPECNPASTTNKITIIADSKTCDAVDNDSAIAHIAPAPNAIILISPNTQEGPPRRTLTYTVTVMNTGNITDNFMLTVSDDQGWGPTISPSKLEIPRHENRTATLTVTVPICAVGSTWDNITVTVTSQFTNTVVTYDNCGAHAKVVRGVHVSISPTRRDVSYPTPGKFIYLVTVTNVGDVMDNYDLTIDNDQPWIHTLDDNRFENVPKGSSVTTLLRVIPSGTFGHCSEDTVTITATGTGVSASASCVAHVVYPVFRRRVRVRISPSYRSVPAGAQLSFTVTVYNRGGDTDNFDLSVSAPSGWSPSITPMSLTNIPAGGSDTATLTVTVPGTAVVSRRYTITVTATSQNDPTASFTSRCIIHRRS
jgi:uncharacterized membrane protein